MLLRDGNQGDFVGLPPASSAGIAYTFLHEGETVYMGIDGTWWRAFQNDGQPVELFMRGQNFRGHARAVLDDPALTDDVFSRLRPTAPGWLPRWANGKLVVIELLR